jgi:uncharacterized membrane protein
MAIQSREARTMFTASLADTMHMTDSESTIVDVETGERLTFGEILADRVTKEIGSWRFIFVYFVLLLLWMGLNTVAWARHWDPYPFIFLNLVLSFQGAFAAPIILMSQNRQEARDRLEEQRDHLINLRAELEVAAVQTRIEELGQASLAEIAALREEQRALHARLDTVLERLERTTRPGPT